jgi:hypothetical protein
MIATKLMLGDKVNVVGGTYVGCTAVIVKVTKHMYQIRLLSFGGHVGEVDLVYMMSWDVEKVEDPNPRDELLIEITVMRDRLDELLDLFNKLHVKWVVNWIASNKLNNNIT